MKRKSENILRASFPLFSASFAAQAINFLVLFVLPFFYTPKDIGQFFVFSALGLLIGPLVSFRSFNAILISDSKGLAEQNLGISIILGALNSVILGFLIFLLSSFPYFNVSEKIGPGYLLPVFVFLMSLFISLENFLNYHKKYVSIGYSKLIKSSITLALIVILGVVSPSVTSIIIAFIFGQLASVIYQAYISKVKWRTFGISRRKFRFFAFKYKDILIFNSSLAVVSELNNHLPTILLSLFYGDSVVAFYGMAQRIFSTPISVLGNSIATVFGKETVELYNSFQKISTIFVSTIKKILTIIVPFGVLGFLLAPWFFDLFFGDEWKSAGLISRVIMPLIVVQNTLVPVTFLYTILNYQKRVFHFYLVSFFIRIVILFILPYLIFQVSEIYLLILYSVSGIIHYWLYYRELKNQIKAYELTLIS